MSDVRVSIIGGSGFYQIEGLVDVEEVRVETPFGPPSDAIVLGMLEGVRVAFLPRHGVGHRILPTDVPFHANIWALKQLGVEQIIAMNAVGSLREEIEPNHFVVPEQLIDRTRSRQHTFFGRGLVAHIGFDDPFCPVLSELLVDKARSVGATVHPGVMLIVVEGPAFSTRAESILHRSLGADVVGMTALPEAKLAREAEICYAGLSMVTDYDTWGQEVESVSAEMVIQNILRSIGTAWRAVREALPALPASRECACGSALSRALITSAALVPEQTKRDLAPIIGRYMPVGAAT